jgi:hypothetical protein
MGDAADNALEYFMNNGIGFGWGGKSRRPTFQSGSGAGMWRTRDGSVIAMKDMSSTHLQNALQKCLETGNSGKAKDIRAELLSRGLKPHEIG